MYVGRLTLVAMLLCCAAMVHAFDPAHAVKVSAEKVQAYVARACACITGKPKQSMQPIKNVPYTEIVRCSCSAHPKPKPRPRQNNTQQSVPADGAKIFIESTAHLLDVLKGSINANNTGKLSNGLTDILNGLQGLFNLITQSRSPQKTSQDFVDFLSNLNEADLSQLLTAARKQ